MFFGVSCIYGGLRGFLLRSWQTSFLWRSHIYHLVIRGSNWTSHGEKDAATDSTSLTLRCWVQLQHGKVNFKCTQVLYRWRIKGDNENEFWNDVLSPCKQPAYLLSGYRQRSKASCVKELQQLSACHFPLPSTEKRIRTRLHLCQILLALRNRDSLTLVLDIKTSQTSLKRHHIHQRTTVMLFFNLTFFSYI